MPRLATAAQSFLEKTLQECFCIFLTAYFVKDRKNLSIFNSA
jgi:hypothetical protein